MKLSSDHKQTIEYLYTIPGWSALEIANELGLTFRQVCSYIDLKCLRVVFYPIARGIERATRANSYPAEDLGFEPPKWRQ